MRILHINPQVVDKFVNLLYKGHIVSNKGSSASTTVDFSPGNLEQ